DVGELGPPAGGDLALVEPDIRVQVGVRVVDARVDHRHDRLHRSGGRVPGGGGVDVGPDLARAVLPGVPHVPLLVQLWVVGKACVDQVVVRLGHGDAGVGAIDGEGAIDRKSGAEKDLVEPR